MTSHQPWLSPFRDGGYMGWITIFRHWQFFNIQMKLPVLILCVIGGYDERFWQPGMCQIAGGQARAVAVMWGSLLSECQKQTQNHAGQQVKPDQILWVKGAEALDQSARKKFFCSFQFSLFVYGGRRPRGHFVVAGWRRVTPPKRIIM